MLNGEKYYASGAGDPRCRIMIVMCRSNNGPDVNRQQSQVLVPLPHPGVTIVGPMHVFGEPDAPHGHMHLRFENVRVPKENMLLGEGRGFEISQLRLGPGRIHHCMRSIGQAERALDLMCIRGLSREAFGRPLAKLGGNTEIISRARIEIEAMRMMVLKAAKAMDVLGNKEARIWISMVKAMVPERVCQIIYQAIQIHGATGVSNGPRSPACTPASAPCASQTARMKSTTWSSAVTSCASMKVASKIPRSPPSGASKSGNGLRLEGARWETTARFAFQERCLKSSAASGRSGCLRCLRSRPHNRDRRCLSWDRVFPRRPLSPG